MSTALRISLDIDKIGEFCRKWSITELAVFGSVLRDDFHADSDVDFLATFAPESRYSLLRHQDIEEELAEIVGRPVDLISRRGVESSENPWRRNAILSTAETVYVA